MSFVPSELKGPAWTVTGGLGGAALGVTMGGPIGAIIGCGVGVFAGSVRAVSGKTLLDIYSAAVPAPPANGSMLPASFEKMLPPMSPANGTCATKQACAPGTDNKPGC